MKPKNQVLPDGEKVKVIVVVALEFQRLTMNSCCHLFLEVNGLWNRGANFEVVHHKRLMFCSSFLRVGTF
jgi:hypothetical protein